MDTRLSSYRWKSCIHLLCHVCRSPGCPRRDLCFLVKSSVSCFRTYSIVLVFRLLYYTIIEHMCQYLKHKILYLFSFFFFCKPNMLCFILLTALLPLYTPSIKNHSRETRKGITELLNISDSFLGKVAYKRIIGKVRKNRFRFFQTFSC